MSSNVKSRWVLFGWFVLGFYRIPEYANVPVSASVGISGAFSLVPFLIELFVMFCLVLSVTPHMPVCFLEKEKVWSGIGGKEAETVIMYSMKKCLFSIREKSIYTA